MDSGNDTGHCCIHVACKVGSQNVEKERRQRVHFFGKHTLVAGGGRKVPLLENMAVVSYLLLGKYMYI